MTSESNPTHPKTDMAPATPSASLDRRGIASEIAAILREEILDGVLRPDAPLKQGHLATRFGTSQGPVREAFRALEAENLVVARPNRGVRVAAFSPREMEELSDLRYRLEPELAALAARAPEKVDGARARVAIATMDAAETLGALMDANTVFHDCIYAASGRPITCEIVGRLRRGFERYLRAMWRQHAHQAISNEEHAKLLDAVLTGDGDRAAEILRAHILGTKREMDALLDQRANR